MLKARRNLGRVPAAGFTLIEILMVVVIIGVMLAVIVPRGWRANVDAKYNMVRQQAAEIGKWGVMWGERNLKVQPDGAAYTSDLADYVDTLQGYTGNNTNTNWVSAAVNVANRGSTGGTRPLQGVYEIISKERIPKNPFSGVSYFDAVHQGGSAIPGLLNLAKVAETVSGTTYDNYYFVFLGTDSANATDWHAGMGTGNLNTLRNGVFVARLAQ